MADLVVGGGGGGTPVVVVVDVVAAYDLWCIAWSLVRRRLVFSLLYGLARLTKPSVGLLQRALARL